MGFGVALAQGGEAEAVLEGGKDRGGVVKGAVDEPLAGQRRHHEGRNPGSRPPAITGRRGHMIPEAAIFIPGDNHGGGRPLGAAFQALDQVADMAVARLHLGVTRVLVVAEQQRREGGNSPR